MRGLSRDLLTVTFVLSPVLLSCIERPDHMASLSDVLLTSPPPMAHPVAAVWDNTIELLGYNVTPEPATRGDRANVTIYYRALQDIVDDWQIFVHCEDQAKVQQRFNMDHYPAGGRARTNVWRKGDIIKDEWSLPYPATESALELWVGFYRDDDRMPISSQGRGVNDGSNRLRMGVLTAQ